MTFKNFKIQKKDGELFSKISGDNNKIHLNDLYGYNSLFGENIVHGILLLILILSKSNFNQKTKNLKSYSLRVNLNKPILYNTVIKISKNIKLNSLSQIFQNNLSIGTISFSNKNIVYEKNHKLFNKKIIKKKRKTKHNRYNINDDLFDILCMISKYVGTIYPGEHSLISNININYNIDLSDNNNCVFYSKKIRGDLPIIDNFTSYNNYEISFQSLIRPQLKEYQDKPNKKVNLEIKKINENILILGGSSGIGNEVLSLYLTNKKIKIIATYHKNKIKLKQKNLIIKKIDLDKDLLKIMSIVKKYKIKKIYYFATPKIYFDNNLRSEIHFIYNNFFFKYPKQIIQKLDNLNLEFFYPSTTYVEINPDSIYSIYKYKFENFLESSINKNIKISIFRFPGINTKQNLSILPQKLTSFTKLINRNSKLFSKFFFKF